MKRLLIAAALGALLLTTASPAAADGGRRPFSGHLTGTTSFPVVSTKICPANDVFAGGLQTQSTATGKATPLGHVQMTAAHCTPKVDRVQGGRMSIVDRRGAAVFTAYSGRCPFDPATAVPGKTVIHCDTAFDILGGTGRYRHATGHADLTADVTFEGFAVPTWPATWSWKGWIRY
jgi:hypothetical protein